jgi:hypothetical protein
MTISSEGIVHLRGPSSIAATVVGTRQVANQRRYRLSHLWRSDTVC